ncbi:thioredoxin-like protein [Coccomyxa subellipsoidea C-169]|uniref:Thioredoxin-like protein n=1 Tax=Coccomyxa subellipsoidea (strain C-169) TaxID=574566 RepID=I0YKT0_COCSC|nr:thioredoxin-like protein [Coccomyxa subellipsoidea C-169]EIE18999.1 thioredoxin-like protein [Coccomyxa subellipsoidea C-169]|eukprot:XP_005643543.1 thioredoxin-like protein [Coccomyxa subellipsoidea C-169]
MHILVRATFFLLIFRHTLADVVVLTDANFDDLVAGERRWIIDIYAPWCKHCVALEPVWIALAERLDGRVMVGKVDGTKEKGLMKRFSVEAFPSVFLVEGAETRAYTGLRTLQELESFALTEYLDVKPVPFYKSPTSLFGRAFAIFVRLPAKFKILVKYLHEEKKYSALVIVAGILGVPLTLGVLFVYLLDVFFGAAERRRAHHRHRD